MSDAKRIDLNADVAESFGRWRLGDDEALLPLLTSANVACGFHAGDASTILNTVRQAAELQISIGAQVSYRDLAGFGRRAMEVYPEDLTADVLYQIAALDGLARIAGSRVSYVKAHGAMYQRVRDDAEQAEAVAEAIAAWEVPLSVLTAPGHLATAIEARGLRVVIEGFADRTYEGDRLVDRAHPHALITDPDAAAEQAVRLAATGAYDSLCVHGDTPGAPAIAAAVRKRLEDDGFQLAPFTDTP